MGKNYISKISYQKNQQTQSNSTNALLDKKTQIYINSTYNLLNRIKLMIQCQKNKKEKDFSFYIMNKKNQKEKKNLIEVYKKLKNKLLKYVNINNQSQQENQEKKENDLNLTINKIDIDESENDNDIEDNKQEEVEEKKMYEKNLKDESKNFVGLLDISLNREKKNYGRKNCNEEKKNEKVVNECRVKRQNQSMMDNKIKKIMKGKISPMKSSFSTMSNSSSESKGITTQYVTHYNNNNDSINDFFKRKALNDSFYCKKLLEKMKKNKNK